MEAIRLEVCNDMNLVMQYQSRYRGNRSRGVTVHTSTTELTIPKHEFKFEHNAMSFINHEGRLFPYDENVSLVRFALTSIRTA